MPPRPLKVKKYRLFFSKYRILHHAQAPAWTPSPRVKELGVETATTTTTRATKIILTYNLHFCAKNAILCIWTKRKHDEILWNWFSHYIYISIIVYRYNDVMTFVNLRHIKFHHIHISSLTVYSCLFCMHHSFCFCKTIYFCIYF